MNLFIDAAQQLVLEGTGITLRGVMPVLNGAPVEVHAPIVHQDDEGITLLYPSLELPLHFGVEFKREFRQTAAWHECVALRYWIENLPAGFEPDSFGIHFKQVQGARAFLKSGYFSWDASAYTECARPCSARGYAMTHFLPLTGSGSMVLGFERHDRFQHTFTMQGGADPDITIETLWDRIPPSNACCESEKLVVFAHSEVEGALRAWARAVAAQAPVPPRHVSRITGWGSWYNLYASMTEENILEHLRGVAETARRENLPLQVFQLDDGFTPEMGDWLEVKPQFPQGIKPILERVMHFD